MLETLGFRTIHPARLSYRDQVSTFSEARVVVGQHGANLASILFSDPGTRVIEIFVPGSWMLHNCYLELCRGNAMRYFRYLAAEDRTIAVEQFRGFVLDAMMQESADDGAD